MRRVIAALAAAAALIALSATAAAASGPYTVGAAALSAVGNHQVLSLCESQTNLGLLNLSLACKPIPVTLADADESLAEFVKKAGGGIVATCQPNVLGLIDIQCTPLNL